MTISLVQMEKALEDALSTLVEAGISTRDPGFELNSVYYQHLHDLVVTVASAARSLWDLVLSYQVNDYPPSEPRLPLGCRPSWYTSLGR